MSELRKCLYFRDISVLYVFILLFVSILQFFAFFPLLVPVLFVSLQVQTGGSSPVRFDAINWIQVFGYSTKASPLPLNPLIRINVCSATLC